MMYSVFGVGSKNFRKESDELQGNGGLPATSVDKLDAFAFASKADCTGVIFYRQFLKKCYLPFAFSLGDWFILPKQEWKIASEQHNTSTTYAGN